MTKLDLFVISLMASMCIISQFEEYRNIYIISLEMLGIIAGFMYATRKGFAIDALISDLKIGYEKRNYTDFFIIWYLIDSAIFKCFLMFFIISKAVLDSDLTKLNGRKEN